MPLCYFYPQELEALLHYNGFDIVSRFGGLDASPLTNTSDAAIYVARAIPQ